MKKAILTISCAAFFAISAKIKAQQLPLTFLQNWQKSYGGTSNDGGSANFIIDNDFIYLPDGGMIICATSNSNNYPNNKTDNSRGLSDYWVIRTDASGNKLWDKTYGGSGTDRVSHIMRTSDGGFLLTGSSTSPVSGEKSQASFGLDDVWLVKIDENGVKLWDKTFGGSSIDGAIASEEYSSGDIIVGATSRSPVSGNKTAALRGSSGYVDSWVIKINSSGDKIWDKSYGGTLDDDTHTIKTTADGGFLLGSISKSGINGTKTSPNLGNWDYWVVKANSAGNQEWDKTYGGTGMDVLSEISAGYDGGYVLAGYSESDVYPAGGHLSGNRGGTDFWLVKIDVSGNHVWDHIYGGTEDDICMGLDKIKSADEGYLMVGWSNSDSYDSGTRYKKRQDNYGPSDCWMVRTNNCGVQW
ncbi:MAG: hypothetical protein K0S12_1838, partial [Bacteroidetes bacterium]|nr:hypothetical protein [Bacteroidota bacterium]